MVGLLLPTQLMCMLRPFTSINLPGGSKLTISGHATRGIAKNDSNNNPHITGPQTNDFWANDFWMMVLSSITLCSIM
jgi:hypothetical protein